MGSNYRFHADIIAMNEGVTGSCNLVITKFPDGKTMRFVAECGLFQEEEYSNLNTKLPFNPEELNTRHFLSFLRVSINVETKNATTSCW